MHRGLILVVITLSLIATSAYAYSLFVDEPLIACAVPLVPGCKEVFICTED